MKIALAAFAVLPWVAVTFTKPRIETVILISGDINGYLSPCGCTKPMQGGVRRLASAVKANTVQGNTIFLYNGGFVSGNGRQDQLKAEAIAEILGKLNVTAMNLSAKDLRLGPSILESVIALSGKNVVISEGAGPMIKNRIIASGLTILSYGDPARAKQLGLSRVRSSAPITPWIAMVQDGGTGQFVKGAKLVITSEKTLALQAPTKRDGAWWVHPGEHGKQLLKLTWNGKQFTSYKVINLGPEWDDQKDASLIYSRYLRRVTGERLLEQMPRSAGEAFAGSKTCGTCHEVAYKIWDKSLHASALKTLEKEGHDRDPDCVSCHVVGLDKSTGYMNRTDTSELADVGCESCHGAGQAHSMNPTQVDMDKIKDKSCMQCHVKNHSPKFDFETYWQKIKH